MGKPRPKRTPGEAVYVSITFDGDDARMLKEFMADEEVPNANTAIRMMVASALQSDRRWWAVVRAQRKSMMFEFRKGLYNEFLKHLRQMTYDVHDEIALFNPQDPSLYNAD